MVSFFFAVKLASRLQGAKPYIYLARLLSDENIMENDHYVIDFNTLSEVLLC